MGLFTQKPEQKSAWAALPGEPDERDGSVDRLPDAVADPLGLGLPGDETSSTVSISVDVVVPTGDGTDARAE